MSKYWIFAITITFCLIVGSVITITFSVRNRLDLETYPVKYENLYDSMEYLFTPDHNNLNIVVLHLKNPGLENNDTYKFSIMSEGSTIISQYFTGFNVGDPADLRFQFDSITDSADKNLILRLDSQTKDDTPILVGVDDNGRLAFSSYYRTTNKFNGFVEIIKNLTFHIGKDPVFFGLLTAALFLVFLKWKN